MFEVFLSEKASKQLCTLPASVQQRVAKCLDQLEHYPVAPKLRILKLTNDQSYRIRLGDYRVLFEVDGQNKRLFITRIKHRKDVYRSLD